MCEFSEKLVAWLDRELPAAEADVLEAHLAGCPECPRRIAAYREVGALLADYGDSVIANSTGSGRRGRVWAGAAAVAACLMILFHFPRSPQGRIAIPPSPEISAPAIAFQQTPTVAGRDMPRRGARKPATPGFQPAPQNAAEAVPAPIQPRPLPEIEIAIPAEAIFPPGAVPAGFQFVAEVSIGADGSAQSLRLRPF